MCYGHLWTNVFGSFFKNMLDNVAVNCFVCEWDIGISFLLI